MDKKNIPSSSKLLLANDSDAQGHNQFVDLTVTPLAALGPFNGTLTINADGTFTYTPNAGSAQNACLSYVNNRSYYSNTTILAVGVRVYNVFTSVPVNGNNNWVVLKLDPTSNFGKAVQINTQGYITAIQNVNTNSC